MPKSQLLAELGKVRLNGNPKEYKDRFAAVPGRGVGIVPDELAGFYCAGLPTDLHLLIKNNVQVKYFSWEQAALPGGTARWLDFLAMFPDLHITYVQGARNQVVDALSRRPGLPITCSHDTPSTPPMLPVGQARAAPRSRGPPANYRELAGFRSRRPRRRSLPSATSPPPPEPNPGAEHLTLTIKTPADPPDVPQWSQAYSRCPVFRVPYKSAANQPGEALQIEFRNPQFTVRYVQPYLHIRVRGLWRICVPQFPEFLTQVLHSHHDHVTAGHRGQKKTFAALSKHYYWPGMRRYTAAYAESCTHCRASKFLNQKPAGLLQQLLIPSRRWAHVSLDFITDHFLTTTGHDSILVMVDSLSKMAHFVPAKKSFTAADTVELLADRLIRYHGFTEALISDRDPSFQSDLWNQLCRRFNIKRCMSSSYHPQSDGQTERVNRTLEQMLRTYIKPDEREWERLLAALELAHNTISHSSTELSPFEVMIGENPLTVDCCGP